MNGMFGSQVFLKNVKNISMVGWLLLLLISIACVWQQVWYLKRKQGAAGPTFVFPLIGSLVPMIKDPLAFWLYHGRYHLSVDMLGPKFVVHISDVDLSKKVTKFVYQ
jgi:cytochrome P450 family 710 subfamily A protein